MQMGLLSPFPKIFYQFMTLYEDKRFPKFIAFELEKMIILIEI